MGSLPCWHWFSIVRWIVRVSRAEVKENTLFLSLGKIGIKVKLVQGKLGKGPDFTEREGMSMMECGQFNFIEGIV
jgi:hypothetical protein